MSESTLFCQVGFGYKDDPESIYFHEKDGAAIGFQIRLPDEEELLDPFSVADLVAGRIDFDLLPEHMRELMYRLAERAFEMIQSDNPNESIKLNPKDIEAAFHLKNMKRTLN